MLGFGNISTCLSVVYVIFMTASSRGMQEDTDTFLYFAYGSNLLKERLTLRNQSAVFVSIGHLKNYTLRFGHWTKNFTGNNSWHGGVATIQESPGEVVWGVIWRLNMKDVVTLDSQEGVNLGIYTPINVTAVTCEGQLQCRCYQMNNFTPYVTSPPYKKVVCHGARQNRLPADYIMKLEAVETNGYEGPSILDDISGLSPHEDVCRRQDEPGFFD